MHKCSAVAKLQIDHGAVGLCCQTIGEAEAFARAGIADLLVSAPVPPWGAVRLAALSRETGAVLAAVCDSAVQVDRLAAAARAEQVILGALVDIDIAMHRTGCAPDDAAALAARIAAADGLSYRGVQAYFGNIQHQAEGRAEAHARRTAILETLVAQLSAAGLAPPVVTGGGTGTYALYLAGGVFTELQCGSYALMDAEYLDCGGPSGTWPFEPALYIAASVVSARHKSHVAVDVGMKASSADVPPKIVAGAAAGSIWRSMGDEHGAVVHPAFFEQLAAGTEVATIDADPVVAVPDDAPREGDIVWLIPGHCDPTINLYDAFYVTDGAGGFDRWAIDARRTSR